MKQHARVFRALVVALALGLCLTGFASVAMAQFDVLVPVGVSPASSSTNGGNYDDPDWWWRQGWSSTLHPQFTLKAPDMNNTPPNRDGVLLGTYYMVDRDPFSAVPIAPPYPSTMYRTGRVSGPYFDNTLDMVGIFASTAPSGWDPSSLAGIEGAWYYHWRWISSTLGPGPTQYDVGFGVDVSAPTAVTGVAVSPAPGVAPTSAWLPSSRALITWDSAKYDSVSGVAYYEVVINGQTYIPETGTTPGSGRVYAMDQSLYPSDPFTFPTSVTIESMPPGDNTIQIRAVDRAQNAAPLSAAVHFRSDPDTPTAAFTSPNGGLFSEHTFISVEASDRAGDPTVVLSVLDPLGDPIATKTLLAPPYQWTPGIVPTLTGTYTIVAKVSDHLEPVARTVTLTRQLDGTVASGFFPTASGGLGTPSTGASVSNPDLPNDSDLWWRQGWGNSLKPDFTLQPPGTTTAVGSIVGMLYHVDRSAATTLDPTHPDLVDRAARGGGTNLSGTLDMLGIGAYDPGPPVGTVEGRWFLHSAFFTSLGYASLSTDTLPFGIDITPPGAVTNLTVSPTVGGSDPATWTASSRAVLGWRPAIDTLSGVAYYQVYLDGSPAIPGTSGGQGRVYELAGRTPSSITIEDVPAGRHTISVTAVDRATNEGSPMSVTVYSDPDTPTISFTSPSGSALSSGAPISVAAADAAGNPMVEIKILGSSIATATFSAPPYSFIPDLGALPPGTYTIFARATDAKGSTATATKFVVWDTVTATIDSVAPNPAVAGQTVAFSGHGTDLNGHGIDAWQWRSSIDGVISSTAGFSKSNLSIGTHTIYFKARCANGMWSDEQQTQVTVTVVPDSVTASIDSIGPIPGTVDDTFSFSGHGTDNKSHALAGYQWRSSLSGVLSSSAAFSKSNLPAGTHTIYFKAQCANGTWSPEVSTTLVVRPRTAVMLPVYRFYNARAGVHFYTASPSERDTVMNTMTGKFKYEGVAYSINTANPANNKPLYRFYNSRKGVHFYTSSESEKNSILADANMSSYMKLDGVAYYVSDYSVTATTVYRFYHIQKGVHFFTASPTERDTVQTKLSSTYRFEGPGFYFEAN